MDIKKKHRTIMPTSFSKIVNELEQAMGLSEKDLQKIRVIWELVQQRFESLRLADESLYEVLLTDGLSEEDMVKEVESCDAYRQKFTLLRLNAEELLQAHSEEVESVRSGSVASSVAVVDTQGKRKFKLPKIEFKKYDGYVRDWMPFWSQFKKIHEDTDIDDCDKIQYLIQSTVEGSRARQVVESFPAINDNYEHIIEALNSRFGREDFQIEVRVRELLGLVITNAVDKNKFDLSVLYDRLATQMRSLHTLGVTSDKFSAMLFPLIESCLPQEVLRVWQRSRKAEESGSSLENRLKGLMEFLRTEVENEEKISMAATNFGIRSTIAESQIRCRKGKSPDRRMPAAMGLVNCDAANKCLFCGGGTHSTDTCFKAREMPLEQKRAVLVEKKACFKCFKIGHQSMKCRKRVQCVLCGRSHGTMICPELGTKRSEKVTEKPKEVEKTRQEENLVAQSLSNLYEPRVFLQTLRVKMKSDLGCRMVRALIDTGSERSYVLKSTAVSLGYVPKKAETIIHGLFGGGKMEQRHQVYVVSLQNDNYSCNFEALDQPIICANVSPVSCGPWMQELNVLGVTVSDTVDADPIELLMGADVAGKLYTGRRQVLRCGLTAMETLLGWTLMGKIPRERKDEENCDVSALSLLVVDNSITNLWKLDVLGITDPAETKSRNDKETEAKDFFSQTVHVNDEGRYEVRLPWVDGHPPLRSNLVIAKKQLDSTMAKLKKENLFGDYEAIFQEWREEGVIEEVHGESSGSCHYLPHRPVIKLNSLTTKIRPVFDASAREKDRPSINQCLEKGINLIELIPTILLRFRKNKIGVLADIRKAFLQISIHPSDRDFLRFLWCDSDSNQIIYRHRRVVFGITSSPFLLGATVEHHLRQCLEQCPTSNEYSRDTILKLLESFYVDNCVTSVHDAIFLERFVRESTKIMSSAKFDLRGWESPYFSEHCETLTPVLGLSWDLNTDMLQLNAECLRHLSEVETNVLTKRLILSIAQRIFDPIGFCCPAMLQPKLLLQEMWEKKIGWDAPISDDARKKFLKWVEELPHLLEIRIPRWTHGEPDCNLSVHTFCDASSRAYSAVIFLRVEKGAEVKVHLLAAKSRVAPLEKTTIPRLELLAALVGSRLCRDVQNNWDGDVKYIWWSDSSTVLSWIRREEEWSIFVQNRVFEIRKLTVVGEWRYVPGTINPADLPSRGCSPQTLARSKWWEGPAWLYKPESEWPREQMEIKEDEIIKEQKKRVHSLFLGVSDEWHLRYFSKYSKIMRMMAWILRFCHNVRNPNNRKQGALCAEEIESAERLILKTIQSESFGDKDDERLRTLNPFRDDFGVIRLRTRISRREDSESFHYPVVLPAGHDVVDRLIQYTHEQSCHVGTGGLLSALREHYWILGGRRNIHRVISKCAICKRQNSKHCVVPTASLPKDRVRDAVAFEVTGVDFSGPLYLKTNIKVWICIFVCAVYRCVHLELVSSMSIEGFLQVLRRFVARRGRPRVIYSDNGTNFVGAENAFNQLDWDRLIEETAVQRIEWRFNPPAAPWWGGFWERLVGVVKQLLKKVLGKASLDYEELLTLLCDCEAVVNCRPLTYLSNDPKELVALTPTMFLRDQVEDGVPDIDAVEASSARKRVAYRHKLRENLRKRFRNEYLGQLKLLYQRGP